MLKLIGLCALIYGGILLYCEAEYNTYNPCSAAASAIGRKGDTVVSMLTNRNTAAGAVARFSRDIFGVNRTSERQLVSGFAHAATFEKPHLACAPIVVGMEFAEKATLSIIIEYLEENGSL